MMFNDVEDGNGHGTHCAGAITSCTYGVWFLVFGVVLGEEVVLLVLLVAGETHNSPISAR
jgi:subtilisin family serine protease